jgi:hypothetical protein
VAATIAWDTRQPHHVPQFVVASDQSGDFAALELQLQLATMKTPQRNFLHHCQIKEAGSGRWGKGLTSCSTSLRLNDHPRRRLCHSSCCLAFSRRPIGGFHLERRTETDNDVIFPAPIVTLVYRMLWLIPLVPLTKPSPTYQVRRSAEPTYASQIHLPRVRLLQDLTGHFDQ